MHTFGLRDRFQALAEATIDGAKDVTKFEKKYSYEKVDNASKDVIDARPHVHQMSIGLPLYIANEYKERLTLQEAYLKKVWGHQFASYVYFGGDCFYESTGVTTPTDLISEKFLAVRAYESEEYITENIEPEFGLKNFLSSPEN